MPFASGDEKKVYDFITRHFLACCSKDAKGKETIAEININGETFTAKGYTSFFVLKYLLYLYLCEGFFQGFIKQTGTSYIFFRLIILEKNYLEVYPYESWNAKLLPRMEVSQRFEPKSIEMVNSYFRSISKSYICVHIVNSQYIGRMFRLMGKQVPHLS